MSQTPRHMQSPDHIVPIHPDQPIGRIQHPDLFNEPVGATLDAAFAGGEVSDPARSHAAGLNVARLAMDEVQSADDQTNTPRIEDNGTSNEYTGPRVARAKWLPASTTEARRQAIMSRAGITPTRQRSTTSAPYAAAYELATAPARKVHVAEPAVTVAESTALSESPAHTNGQAPDGEASHARRQIFRVPSSEANMASGDTQPLALAPSESSNHADHATADSNGAGQQPEANPSHENNASNPQSAPARRMSHGSHIAGTARVFGSELTERSAVIGAGAAAFRHWRAGAEERRGLRANWPIVRFGKAAVDLVVHVPEAVRNAGDTISAAVTLYDAFYGRSGRALTARMLAPDGADTTTLEARINGNPLTANAHRRHLARANDAPVGQAEDDEPVELSPEIDIEHMFDMQQALGALPEGVDTVEKFGVYLARRRHANIAEGLRQLKAAEAQRIRAQRTAAFETGIQESATAAVRAANERTAERVADARRLEDAILRSANTHTDQDRLRNIFQTMHDALDINQLRDDERPLLTREEAKSARAQRLANRLRGFVESAKIQSQITDPDQRLYRLFQDQEGASRIFNAALTAAFNMGAANEDSQALAAAFNEACLVLYDKIVAERRKQR